MDGVIKLLQGLGPDALNVFKVLIGTVGAIFTALMIVDAIIQFHKDKDYKNGFKYLAIGVLIAVVAIAGFGFISAIATSIAPTSLDGVGSIATNTTPLH
ncbi:hypothetical protein [uncultured Prevotella sp.]|uniref:hypothetical protein n=1 Tax=uncultured Prevotella sp. TaxID=159272 RepID=UPI00259BDAF3|nr:hypothetical protein [uncultured Prevotella sp.]